MTLGIVFVFFTTFGCSPQEDEINRPANESEPNRWGLYNMRGNVGGWYDCARHVRSAYRPVSPSDYTDYKRGFGMARNVE